MVGHWIRILIVLLQVPDSTPIYSAVCMRPMQYQFLLNALSTRPHCFKLHVRLTMAKCMAKEVCKQQNYFHIDLKGEGEENSGNVLANSLAT